MISTTNSSAYLHSNYFIFTLLNVLAYMEMSTFHLLQDVNCTCRYL